MTLRSGILLSCLAAALLVVASGRLTAKPPDSQPASPPAAQPVGPNPPTRPVPTGAKPIGPVAQPPASKLPPSNAPPAPQATVKLNPGELPQIEFDTPIYDFGRIKTGKDIEHDFWFHNGGTGPLEIISVKPS